MGSVFRYVQKKSELLSVLPAAGPREEAEDRDGRQGAVQSVCCGGEKADLAGQPGPVWGRSVPPAQAVHRGEGSGALQQRRLRPAQLLQPVSKDAAPGGGEPVVWAAAPPAWRHSTCGMTLRLLQVVLKLTQMIGKNVKLYDMVLQFLRTLFLRTRNVHYCTLRAELLMSLHDLDITEICSVDPCHKVRRPRWPLWCSSMNPSLNVLLLRFNSCVFCHKLSSPGV